MIQHVEKHEHEIYKMSKAHTSLREKTLSQPDNQKRPLILK
jgi:hypothetical protein